MNNLSIQSLYRKYRPATFAEIRGQDHVVTALTNALESKTLAHAYLFSGVRGTGKTSIARILASELDTSPEDIIEIDAASHTGVENIRELRDGIATRPFSSDYKIYIIDEAHMLSKSAFNALLKTLEEPPSHVVFVLATTEKHKILDTIISRCQVYDFNRPDKQTLSQLVLDVCKQENKIIDPESVLFIARRGDGSFRDTLSFLQQVFAHFDSNITYSKLTKIFVTSSSQSEQDLLEHLVGGDSEQAFAVYQQYRDSDGNSNQLLDGILEKTRQSLLIKNSKTFADSYKQQLATDHYQWLAMLPATTSHLSFLLDLSQTLRKSTHPDIAFEVGLLQYFQQKK